MLQSEMIEIVKQQNVIFPIALQQEQDSDLS
jgi:hypothetical protein